MRRRWLRLSRRISRISRSSTFGCRPIERTTVLARHASFANASCIGLRVARIDGKIVVQVRYDGKGGAVLHERSALSDRVAALGGSLSVDSPAGRGTIVEATLPCA